MNIENVGQQFYNVFVEIYVKEIVKDLYKNVENQIKLGNSLQSYRKGTIVLKRRNNVEYYYLSYRDKNRVKTDYLGKLEDKDIKKIKKELDQGINIRNKLKELRNEEEKLRKIINAIDRDALKKEIYEVIDLIVLIRPILKSFSLNEVYLFGSCARGDANPNSDINLLIYKTNKSIDDLIKKLEKATKKNIDIVTSGSRIPPEIMENIEEEKILIYAGY